MLHVFNSSAKGRVDTVKKPRYLLNPKTNLYYIASFETMKKSLITKLLLDQKILIKLNLHLKMDG